MGRRTTFKRCTACKMAGCAFYLVQTVWTIFFLVLCGKALKSLTFEPSPLRVVNVDWAWLWSAFAAFATFSVVNMIVSLASVVSIVAHWWLTSKTIPEYEGLRPKRGLLARVSYLITMFAYFLLCCAALVMFGMALASTVNLSGKFGRPTPRSYDGCDPIDPTSCVFPFPSSYYLHDDSTTITKFRVHFPPKSLMKTMDGSQISPAMWNELDGFSTIAPILFYLQDAVATGLVPHTNIAQYLEANASTVILDLSTGQRVAHWTELDAIDPHEPSIIIQPASALKHATRFLVVVQNVINSKGELISRTPGFASLMASVASANVDTKRYEHYKTVLIPAIVAAGLDPEKVQLAWDFVTTSRESVQGRYEQMRDIALNFNPIVTLVKEEEGNCANSKIGRSLTVRVTSPNFLDHKHHRGGFLPRKNGAREPVVAKGETETFVLIRVPCSLTQPEHPQAAAQVVEFGHGLFGTRQEIAAGWIGEWLDRTKMIFFASDWFGMSKFDKLQIVRIILSDLSNFAIIPESIMQGWANKVVIYKSMQSGQLRQLLHNSGISLVPHNAQIPFYGISQGGILGGGYAASSPFISRAALGVPGSPFSLLLARSHDFDMFKTLFGFSLYGWRDIRLALTLMQQLWDQGESAGWLSNVPTSNPQKTMLIQDAHGDAQVTILGAQVMARMIQAKNLMPAVGPIWGVSPTTASDNVTIVSSTTHSAITEWRYENVPAMPFENIAPSEEYDTHECVRREPLGQDQIFEFFSSGIISQTCNGPCTKASCKILDERQRRKLARPSQSTFEKIQENASTFLRHSVLVFTTSPEEWD